MRVRNALRDFRDCTLIFFFLEKLALIFQPYVSALHSYLDPSVTKFALIFGPTEGHPSVMKFALISEPLHFYSDTD